GLPKLLEHRRLLPGPLGRAPSAGRALDQRAHPADPRGTDRGAHLAALPEPRSAALASVGARRGVRLVHPAAGDAALLPAPRARLAHASLAGLSRLLPRAFDSPGPAHPA